MAPETASRSAKGRELPGSDDRESFPAVEGLRTSVRTAPIYLPHPFRSPSP